MVARSDCHHAVAAWRPASAFDFCRSTIHLHSVLAAMLDLFARSSGSALRSTTIADKWADSDNEHSD